MFKTELHCHSAGISFCASVTVDEIVEKYVRAGYTSILLTNHFESGTMRRHGCEDYGAFLEKFVEEWKKLRDAAAGRLNVLFGAELRFDGNINDYLLYGVTPEFLLAHPDVFSMSPETFSHIAREAGILFIHAHPFRNGMKVINPQYLDGIEVFNGHIRHDSRNDVASMWAKKYGLIKTSGSDMHIHVDQPDAGIMTESPITSVEQLASVIRSGKYTLITSELPVIN